MMEGHEGKGRTHFLFVFCGPLEGLVRMATERLGATDFR